MELTKKNKEIWDPFDVLTELQADLNRAFSRSLTRRDRWGEGFQPDMEVVEENDHFLIKADLPGMKKEDFSISIEGNHLTLKGERKEHMETKEKGRYFSERWYGSFSRLMEFPTEIQADKVKASYKDGVLEVTLPKAESAKPRQINVEVK